MSTPPLPENPKKPVFVWYKINTSRNSYYLIKGLKSTKYPGHYYPFIDKNLFSERPKLIPKGAIRQKLESWCIKEFFYDPKQHHAVLMPIPQHDAWYEIHDNGSRPWVVFVKGSTVDVYRIPEDAYMHESKERCDTKDILGYYSEKFLEFKNVERVFPGVDHGEKKFLGNSVLLKLSNHHYVYIGAEIYSFTTNDEIQEYNSRVGNSDVPYPFALSKDSVYFMLDRVVFPRAMFSFFNDVYQQYYDLPKNTKKPEFHELRILEKTEWARMRERMQKLKKSKKSS